MDDLLQIADATLTRIQQQTTAVLSSTVIIAGPNPSGAEEDEDFGAFHVTKGSFYSLSFLSQEVMTSPVIPLYHLFPGAKKTTDVIHTLANEPSVGLFRVREHIQRSLPFLVDRKVRQLLSLVS